MKKTFQIVVMGCLGGPFENNLPGYLLSPVEEQEWIALDGGSLLGGIEKAFKKKNLSHVSHVDSKLNCEGDMLINHIRAVLVSHAHLDHILGLVLNSQIDRHKYILGIDPTINNIRDHIFNGLIWPNYGNEGREPILKLYQYVRLALHEQQSIPTTTMNVEPYLLSHPGGYPSTAFLIEYKGFFFLYIGDTSSDDLEIEKHLTRIWKRIGPLIKSKKLLGMILECSYTQRQPEKSMFGHLNSRLMIKELHRLQEISETPLQDFKIIVSHRKDSLERGIDSKEKIREELLSFNDLKIDFLFPEQGDLFTF